MSSIEIICRKDIDNTNKSKGYDNYDKSTMTGNELKIEVSQWFMDTEKFFNSVKESLEKYFDNIQKK